MSKTTKQTANETNARVLAHLKEIHSVSLPPSIAYRLELSDSAAYRACRELWKAGKVTRTKVWCGQGWHHRRAGYFLGYYAKDK